LAAPVTSVNLGFPLIGILTTEDNRFRDKERFFELAAFSFVSKSYVNWVEQTGAMAVIIPFDSEESTFSFLLENVQGLIIQSGKTPYLDSKGEPTLIQRRITKALKKAVEINKEKYYPVIVEGWGVQGFVNAFSDNADLINKDIDNVKRSTSVQVTTNFRNSRIFKEVDSTVVGHVFARNLLYFSIESGYERYTLEHNSKFGQQIMVTGVSRDINGKEFVSIMEHRKYPILATVYQLERTQFERQGPNVFLARD
jgi:hypothetical protein